MTNPNQIETLLAHIQPKPSERLHDRLQDAPWQTSQPKQHAIVRTALAWVAAFVLMSAAIFLTPLNTLAQELVGRFFEPFGSASRVETITRDIEPTPASESIYWQPQAIADIQATVDFEIAQPTQLPAGYRFDGADQYDMDGVPHVMLTYRMEGDELGRNLVLIQYPGTGEPMSVGQNAVIDSVQIGDVTGEYTRGTWATTENTVIETEGTIETRELERVWDPTLGFHHLRWERDGMTYSMMFQETGYAMFPDIYEGGKPDAAGYLTQADLIAIAESVR